MAKDLYSKENLKNLQKLSDLAPEQLDAYNNFDNQVFKDGALSLKEKEIIAVAMAHVTQCPYCIDIHTKNAKKAGASLEELAEAVFVASALEAGGAVTHSTHIPNATDDNADDALYTRSNLKKLGNLGKDDPDGFKGYNEFSAAAMKAGALSVKFKEIIAVATAMVTQCPYCIDVHAGNADEQGATREELSEAVLVASALRAGGAYAHMANMIQSYEEA